MSTREKYIIKTKEVNSLLAGLVAHGPERTYEQMKLRATRAMEASDDVDEMFLDMAESMLKKARNTRVKKDEQSTKPYFYTLASMLRRLAHEINRAYIRTNRKADSVRFIRLVFDNPEAPTIDWQEK